MRAMLFALLASGCQYMIGLEDTKTRPDAPPPPIDSPADATVGPPVTVGDGADNALVVETVVYTDGTRTALAMAVLSGSTMLHVADATGFANGDEILIMQMTGTNAGQHETVDVMSTLSTQLLTTPLRYSYEGKVQVVKVPNYTTVTVKNGGVLTARPWDGDTGGIVFFRAKDSLSVEQGGAITANELGFAGGDGGNGGVGGAGATGGNGGFRANCPVCGLAGANGGPAAPGTIMTAADGGPGVQHQMCTGGTGGKGGVYGDDGQPGTPASTGEGPGGGAAGGIGGANATTNVATRPLLGGGGGGGLGGIGGRGGGGGGGGGGSW